MQLSALATSPIRTKEWVRKTRRLLRYRWSSDIVERIVFTGSETEHHEAAHMYTTQQPTSTVNAKLSDHIPTSHVPWVESRTGTHPFWEMRLRLRERDVKPPQIYLKSTTGFSMVHYDTVCVSLTYCENFGCMVTLWKEQNVHTSASRAKRSETNEPVLCKLRWLWKSARVCVVSIYKSISTHRCRSVNPRACHRTRKVGDGTVWPSTIISDFDTSFGNTVSKTSNTVSKLTLSGLRDSCVNEDDESKPT